MSISGDDSVLASVSRIGTVAKADSHVSDFYDFILSDVLWCGAILCLPWLFDDDHDSVSSGT